MERLFKDIENAYGKDKARICRDVTSIVKAKIKAKNLFGWKDWIEEHLSGLIGYMINDDFKHSGGAYVTCGMQGAIDYARHCSAEKRRGNYELLSLDEFYQVGEDIEDSETTQSKADELLLDIEICFGKKLADMLEPFLRGYEDKLTKDALKIVKSDKFAKWYKEWIEEN